MRYDADTILAFVSRWADSPYWWHREASRSFHRGWYRAITGRAHDDLYLLRLWLHQPPLADDGAPESGEQLLLHWIVRPDDDAALHDHPWDFRTTILEGGYWEDLPNQFWDPALDLMGPAPAVAKVFRGCGATIVHQAGDLHRISTLVPTPIQPYGGGTWTLVRTAARVREWGFHPTGQRWQPWNAYLGQATAQVVAQAAHVGKAAS